jgi:serine/threonine protein kinase
LVNFSSYFSLSFDFLYYLAPEVVNYEPLTCATDMWSIGVLIYVIITGHTPFGGTTKLDTQNNITHCVLDFPKDLFEKISTKCIDLIKKLIVRIPK